MSVLRSDYLIPKAKSFVVVVDDVSFFFFLLQILIGLGTHHILS